MTMNTTVVGINFTDLTEDGTDDPLSTVVLDLCTTAARLVQSPTEHVGATTSLTALRNAVAEGLPETATLIGAVLDLVELSVHLTTKEETNGC
jgi:hypothetical protein